MVSPSLADRLRAAMNEARKQRDQARTLLLSTIISDVKNRELELNHPPSDDETVEVLRRTVPAAVPGVLFLSGGQSDEQATARLDAINRLGAQPWELSFSFGRALQAPVLHAWAGNEANRQAAQDALLKRARLNGAARQGRYDAHVEQ